MAIDEYHDDDSISRGLGELGLRDGDIADILDDLDETIGAGSVGIAVIGPDDQAPRGADVILRDNGDGTRTIEVVGSGKTTMSGTSDADEMSGGRTDDKIAGRGGDDTILGHDGDDTLGGGAGDDTIKGGRGDDFVQGGKGDDTLKGGEGDDTLSGGQGSDRLWGGAGDDTLRGGMGDDTLFGGAGDDLLSGGSGDDVIYAGGGDTVRGGDGNDVVRIAANLADVQSLEPDIGSGGGKMILTFDDGSVVVLKGIETIEFDDGDIDL